MSETSPQKMKRPLSPHLQIYRPQLTAITSILHRATGYAMSIGLALFVWWLVAAASGPEAYAVFTGFCASWIGKLLLLGWTIAFYYHLANGIRHLIWDSGKLLTIKSAYKAGYFVLAFTAVATVLTWYCISNATASGLGNAEDCREFTSSYDKDGEFYKRCMREGICVLPNVNCAYPDRVEDSQ